MAQLSVQPASIDGTVLVFSPASASGDSVKTAVATGVAIWVKNGDVAPVTITIPVLGKTRYGVDMPDKTITVAAGAGKLITIHGDYTDKASGLASFTFSSTTNVTVAAITV
jgi:hypothetical protein